MKIFNEGCFLDRILGSHNYIDETKIDKFNDIVIPYFGLYFTTYFVTLFILYLVTTYYIFDLNNWSISFYSANYVTGIVLLIKIIKNIFKKYLTK